MMTINTYIYMHNIRLIYGKSVIIVKTLSGNIYANTIQYKIYFESHLIVRIITVLFKLYLYI